MSMQTRRVGRTDLALSVVGFGTCQLRLVPEEQALATLRRGFELGVNWVHVSPDYGGAEELVAQAIAESGLDVIAVSDGSGSMEHFEHLFERTCRIFGRDRLPLWGISCIDDQEFVGNDVWGPRGMVEFLLQKKREGRIGAAYCTTHAPPDYVANLVESGCFDAIMLAYNPLGFHVLSSYASSEGKLYEDVAANRERILGLARARGVSILAMKALGGGLIGRSQAFPPRALHPPERASIRAADVLRHVLSQEGVTAVVPGTASVEEAEENALAGHGPIELAPDRTELLENRVAALRTTLCSRCGACEPTCSQGLPISWLFRDAYMWLNPADTFDAVPRLHYFHLHPETEIACATCTAVTCACPQGLDVPLQLGRVHAGMLDLRDRGLLPRTPAELEAGPVGDEPRVLLVHSEVPPPGSDGPHAICRLWFENAGTRRWARAEADPEHVHLRVGLEGRAPARLALREDVHPGQRAHMAFLLPAPPVRFELVAAQGAVVELPVGAAHSDPR